MIFGNRLIEAKLVMGAIRARAREENPGTQAPGAIIGAIRPREAGTHPEDIQINGPEWSSRAPRDGGRARWGRNPASLAAYRRERARAAGSIVGASELVGGFQVTEFQRPRRRMPILEGSGMNSKHYSPWRWGSG